MLVLFLLALLVSALLYRLLWRFTSIRGGWLAALSAIPLYLVGSFSRTMHRAPRQDDVGVILLAGLMVVVVILVAYFLWGWITRHKDKR